MSEEKVGKRYTNKRETNGKEISDNMEVYTIKNPRQPRRSFKTGQFKKGERKFPGPLNPNKISAMNQVQTFPGKTPIDKQKRKKFSRGDGLNGSGIKNPIHAVRLQKKDRKIQYAEEQSARQDILFTEEQGGLEIEDNIKTTSISQKIIAENVDIAAAAKIFELNLDFGPYRAKYTKNGRHLVLGGKKGHLAAFDWVTKKLHCEINVMESIHDVCYLHIETMIAVAQKEWLHIYDNTGTELHCVKAMDKILRMEFLPYHFLLAGVNEYGFMTWLDVSIGERVGHFNNNLGRTSVMTQNPYNGTLCLGNSQGVVSIWSPNVKQPLAKILCHKTPLTAIAVDNRGMYMATSGVDRSLKIFDIRNIDGPVQHYKLRSAPVDLEFSQKDMLAVGLGNVVEIYNNCCSQTTEKPYMRHRMANNIENLKFCPYEDVLGLGTRKGFTSIIIPGSGEPNFDALESNPFQNKVQRREAEVKALLEKIPAELITLNPYEVTEVDVPTMQEKFEAKKKILSIKPKNIDFKLRHKKSRKSNIARKKIIKEQNKKDQIIQHMAAKKELNLPEKAVMKKSFGVLNRFVSNKK